jgi:hypothetical protein
MNFSIIIISRQKALGMLWCLSLRFLCWGLFYDTQYFKEYEERLNVMEMTWKEVVLGKSIGNWSYER